MKTIKEIINEAFAKGNDVLIDDGFFTLHKLYDDSKFWHILGEDYSRAYTEEEISQMQVARVEELKEGITIIYCYIHHLIRK